MLKENGMLAKVKQWCISVACGGCLLTAMPAMALDTVQATQSVQSAISALENQQNVTDGGWGVDDNTLAYVQTSASVEALRAANQRTPAYYRGIAWLENHNAANADTGSRKVLGLVDHGNNLQADLDTIFADQQAHEPQQLGWGLSEGYYPNALETALVLRALQTAMAVNSGTERDHIINFLLANQNADGGWSLQTTSDSDYWITAEVVMALLGQEIDASITDALVQAATFLQGVDATNDSHIVARVTQALFRYQGLEGWVDQSIQNLLSRQAGNGEWEHVLATASSLHLLSLVLELDLTTAPRVSIHDEALREYINTLLGHTTYGNLSQADLQTLNNLDLRELSIASLEGLQYATNLSQIKVNGRTNVAALSSLTDVDIVVDSDGDDIADSNDNCPHFANPNQLDENNNALGDACEFDFLVANLRFPDKNLTACVEQYAETKGWQYTDEITALSCVYNDIAVADGIEQLSHLETLDFTGNLLTAIDVSSLLKLKQLSLNHNQLRALNVDGLVELTTLDVWSNQLTELDVADLTKLTKLHVDNNQLSELYVAHLLDLQSLHVGNNLLTTLDVANLHQLTQLWAYNNQIAALDVSLLVNLTGLHVSDNTLTSLAVDDLLQLTYLNVANNQLTSLNTSDLVALVKLYTQNNSLAELNVSVLTQLDELDVSNNQLTTLDVAALNKLVVLLASNNQLSVLEVSDLLQLVRLHVDNNQLTALDVSNLVLLISLNVENNHIISLDVSTLINLERL